MQLSNDEISTGILHIKQAILSRYKMLKDIENLSIPDVESDLRNEADELKKVAEFLRQQIGESQNAN